MTLSDNRDLATLPNLQPSSAPSIWAQTRLGPPTSEPWLRALAQTYSHLVVDGSEVVDVEAVGETAELTGAERALLEFSRKAREALAVGEDGAEEKRREEEALRFFKEREGEFGEVAGEEGRLPWEVLHVAEIALEVSGWIGRLLPFLVADGCLCVMQGYCLLDIAVENRLDELAATRPKEYVRGLASHQRGSSRLTRFLDFLRPSTSAGQADQAPQDVPRLGRAAPPRGRHESHGARQAGRQGPPQGARQPRRAQAVRAGQSKKVLRLSRIRVGVSGRLTGWVCLLWIISLAAGRGHAAGDGGGAGGGEEADGGGAGGGDPQAHGEVEWKGEGCCKHAGTSQIIVGHRARCMARRMQDAAQCERPPPPDIPRTRSRGQLCRPVGSRSEWSSRYVRA